MSSPKLKITSKLGKGAYAKVYETFDTEIRKYQAIKIINGEKDEGLPCMVEFFIVKDIIHPHLICSEDTYIRDSKLYVTQKLATTDLRRWRITNVPTPEQIKTWTFHLIDALLCLHKVKIVHGDIKADNLLLMKDGSIKLADFSLSKIGNKEKAITCAAEHRAAEIWKYKITSRLIDVWALGCTLIEISHLKLLFRRQSGSTFKEEKIPSLKAIRHWKDIRTKILDGTYDQKEEEEKCSHIQDYIPPQLPASFDANLEFNQFILFILDPDYETRPNLHNILDHSYMRGFVCSEFQVNCMKLDYVPEWVMSRALKYTASKHISQLTVEFYSQLQYQVHEISIRLTERDLFETCFWMAYKVIRTYPPVSDRFITKVKDLIRFESILLKETDFTIFKCPV
uniref:Putative serine/threonine protein kinase n=1 Tax=Pithovirus LCPAC404 TaxID=2506597 RepID=A0A481ZCG9_9VIRU|nr:MAG: putative serine/threonine protein kinase [Pithovirus LCPAC404]